MDTFTVESLRPILDLLGGEDGTWVTTTIVRVMAVSAILAPFAARLRNALADALNRVAATSDLDDDAYLRKLFSNPGYKLAAFLLNFANIRLPVLAELERAIALRCEAVAEAEKLKAIRESRKPEP